MSLLKAYDTFLNHGDTRSLIDFFDHYDFKGFKDELEEALNLFRKKEPVEQLLFRSNGSTGANTSYEFGSHPFVVPTLESAMRGMKGVRGLIRLNSAYPFYDTTRFEMMPWDDGSFLLKLDFTSKKSAEFFIDHVPPGSTVETQPHICRMMCAHEEIVRHISQNAVKVFSTCDDLSIKRNAIPVMDRMIDWKTGVNFFECSFGSKHFYPIWIESNGRIVNLLNFADKEGHEMSDIFEARDFSPCECGRTAVDIRLVSHFRFKPEVKNGEKLDSASIKELAELIPEEIFHIQILEAQDKIKILADPFMSEKNSKKIEDFFGKETSVIERKVFKIGGHKMPFAWKSDYLNLREARNPII
jgi:hypothetical protein